VIAARALLHGLVDYAGLFPPASLPMSEAVRRFASHRKGPWSWALGRFVVPVARLAEFSNAAGDVLPSGDGAAPWRVSAIVADDPAAELGEVLAFNARHARPGDGRARVDAVETKSAAVESVARVFDGFSVAFEVDHRLPALGEALEAVKAGGSIAKLRTGGVTEDAFPSTESVARFLWACAAHDVAFKLTAGLHHAVRGEYALTYEEGSPRGTMHGLLNVLVAALAARRLAGGAGTASRDVVGGRVPALVLTILADRDRAAFRCDGDRLVWGSEAFRPDEIESGRADLALSIGSCSFDEPLHEIGAMGWLA
jgi:hypothetical protein